MGLPRWYHSRHALPAACPPRPHYGWAIAAILFLGAALNIGAGTYAFGLFVEPSKTRSVGRARP